MPFNRNSQNNNNSRRPSQDNNQNSSQSRRPSSDRGRRQQNQKAEQKKTVYLQLFSLFGNEHSGDRLQVDIKTLESDNYSIEDVLTVDEFLFFCEKLYYGEAKLTGSLWYKGDSNPQYSGNIRVTEDYINELKEEYRNSGSNQEQEERQEQPVKPVKYAMPPKEEELEEEELPY